MNKDIRNNAIAQVIISAVALLSMAGLIFYLLRKTLKPIEGIVSAAESIAEGNLEIHLESKSNDEIGRLSKAFDITAQRLKEMIDDTNYILENMADGNFDINTRTEDSYVGQFGNLLQ